MQYLTISKNNNITFCYSLFVKYHFVLTWPPRAKVFGHSEQLYGFSPVWIRMCNRRRSLIGNDLPHRSQVYCSSVPCCEAMWFFRHPACRKRFLQCGHGYGRSSLCIRKCLRKSLVPMKSFWHTSHWYSFRSRRFRPRFDDEDPPVDDADASVPLPDSAPSRPSPASTDAFTSFFTIDLSSSSSSADDSSYPIGFSTMYEGRSLITSSPLITFGTVSIGFLLLLILLLLSSGDAILGECFPTYRDIRVCRVDFFIVSHDNHSWLNSVHPSYAGFVIGILHVAINYRKLTRNKHDAMSLRSNCSPGERSLCFIESC